MARARGRERLEEREEIEGKREREGDTYLLELVHG
jgi:hypothetical protein